MLTRPHGEGAQREEAGRSRPGAPAANEPAPARVASLGADNALLLQGTAGNRAVSMLLSGGRPAAQPAPGTDRTLATPSPRPGAKPAPPAAPRPHPDAPAPPQRQRRISPASPAPSTVTHGVTGRRATVETPLVPPQAIGPAREVVTTVEAAGTDGARGFTATVDARLDQLERTVVAEQDSLENTAVADLLSVDATFVDASARLSAALTAAGGRLHQAAGSERARAAAWAAQTDARVRAGYQAQAARASSAGAKAGSEADRAANESATSTAQQIEALAGQAQERGAQRAASPGGSDAKGRSARATAAHRVAGDTANTIRASLHDAVGKLQALGPDSREQLVQQADQVGDAILAGLPDVIAAIGRSHSEIDQAAARVSAGGTAALDQLGARLNAQLTQVHRSVQQAVRVNADEAKRAVAAAGTQALSAAQDERERTTRAAMAAVSGALAGVAARRMRRTDAPRVARELCGQVIAGFMQGGARADQALDVIINSLSDSAAAAVQALQSATADANQRVDATAAAGQASAETELGSIIAQLAQRVTEGMSAGTGLADRSLAGLDTPLAQLDQRLAGALEALHTTLAQQSNTALGHARDPLNSLDARMSKAMQQADEEAHRSWFGKLVHSIPWGTILGVVAAVVITLAVIAIAGTGIGALILAGALAGAVSTLVSTLVDDAVHGRKVDWKSLAIQMTINAVVGAVAGAAGGGISAAVGEQAAASVGIRLVLKPVVNATIFAAGQVASNEIEGKPWSQGVVERFVTGGVISVLVGAISPYVPVRGAAGTGGAAAPEAAAPEPAAPAVPEPAAPEPATPEPATPEPATPAEAAAARGRDILELFGERQQGARAAGDLDADLAESGALSVRPAFQPPGGGAQVVEVTAEGSEGTGDPTLDYLNEHVQAAQERFEAEGFTADQTVAIERAPTAAARDAARARFYGERIDTFTKESVYGDRRLDHLGVSEMMQPGPDFFDSLSGKWYDITTARSWAEHLVRYATSGAGVLVPSGR